ncbi:lipase/esterase (alpha/beta fold) [Trichoderma guizhouense]|uniref:Lipase/esterase (Alpha/beta fold) n=1 Tax=Trichoderma guizhouense TaxID=1491466 RepID=A0A1T3CKS1_9HYPO|nr:lipase/esterase (alpha/beta fold) [Trichoderma guizhouense]
MAMATYETAKTQFVKVDGLTFAYRQLGVSHGIPLLFIPGFKQTMDHWDPALVNPLAAQRPVLLIDNAGIGRSEGDVPDTFAGWAAHYSAVTKQILGEGSKVDVLGYSMGGCVAQLMALNAPKQVRRLVLCGTIPSSGDGVKPSPDGKAFKRMKAARTVEEEQQAFEEGSFVQRSERSREAGKRAWKRIANGRSDSGEVRCEPVPPGPAHKQALAFVRFMDKKNASDGSYDRLGQLRLPVLIANGCEDLLLPTDNSILIWKMLSFADARLHLFPDSGHGFLYQYADELAKLVNDFLGSSSSSRGSRL